MKAILITVAVLFAYAACSDNQQDNIKDLGRVHTAPAKTDRHKKDSLMPPTGQPASEFFSGVITETIDVEFYTYIKFRSSDNRELWAAVFRGTYKKGQSIKIESSVIMDNFRSGTLNRTFKKIIFGNTVELDGKPVKPAADPRKDAKRNLPPGHPDI